ncbi:MAG: DNA repair protein RecN [Bacteroidaceae bacterium]|nr:DNA repair protein RecN [Bacteroidaceae bacterium]
MIQNLRIKNYALIENLDIDFHDGFSAITGETGAGKSIIMGALGLLLGGRSDVKSIKPGCKSCVIEATFNLSGFSVSSFFDDNDLDFDGTECIMRRELSATGKSRSFINDTPVNVSLLKELGNLLVDIHSQHQNLLLNDRLFQLSILDTVANNGDIATKYQGIYAQLQEAERRLREFEDRILRQRDNNDYLNFQLNELSQAQLKEGELEELEEESQLLNHAEFIKEKLYRTHTLLTNEDKGIVTKLSECVRHLQELSDVFPKTAPLAERLDSCAIELDDIGQDISSQLEKIQFDPERNAYVNERLDLLNSLLNKYHKSDIKDLIEMTARLRNEVQSLADSDETLKEMRQRRDNLQKEALSLATTLSESRRSVTHTVEKQIITRLQGLGMPSISFRIDIQQNTAQLSPTGIDTVTFLFSANKDMPLQDMAHIASGGEIARVMLSLKALLSANRQMRTLIFDEIDTGVSGRTASQMARTMQDIAHKGNQVISITHLPQIASAGQHHYLVFKEEDAQGTHTNIRELDYPERIQEIAHMLSGAEITPAAVSNAQSLLKSSGHENP